jgi:hypothetical protein
MQTNKVFKAVVVLPFFTAALALAGEPQQARQNQFWEQVHGLMQRCTIQKTTGPLESNCAEVQVKGSQARFQLGNEWYLADIVESAESDGGDLNDVTVLDQNGATVAQRTNTLAFGDILLALAGGQL